MSARSVRERATAPAAAPVEGPGDRAERLGTLAGALGNARFAALIGTSKATSAVLARDPPTTPTGHEEVVDAQTFAGFTAWAEASIADADEACANATATSNALRAPYQQRLRQLNAGVVMLRNQIDNGMTELMAGRPAPALRSNARVALERLDEATRELEVVRQAWDEVLASGLFELLARVGEAQVARARALEAELRSLLRELQALQRIVSGEELHEAFAQAGADAAITIAVAAITAVNPAVGLAVSLGGTAVQLGLDAVLGVDAPGVPGALSLTGSGASAAGATLERVGREIPRLRTAGRLLGAAGTGAGTLSDVLETVDAVQRYQAAIVRMRTIGPRIDRVARDLEQLRPLLEYPELAQRLIGALRHQAETLREHGQLALARTGQR